MFFTTSQIYALRKLKSFTYFPSEYRRWKKRNFSAPLPATLKRNFLLSRGIDGASWIETGTYKGETAFYLSKSSKHVISIEPDLKLFSAAKKGLSGAENVTILLGKSEEVFLDAIELADKDVNFFLDGHFSGGETFQADLPTPLVFELETISRVIHKFEKVVVVIDDVRLCRHNVFEESGYPSLDFLVNWAQSNSMSWFIENDMFVAERKSP